MSTYPKIIVAVDGSEHSMTAAALAHSIATRDGSRLEALYVKDASVIHAPYWRDFGPITLPVARFDKTLEAYFQSRGEATIAALRQQYPTIEGRITEGRVEQEIIKASREADLIVLGAAGESHEETADEDHLGARLERIMSRVASPVLVAPQRRVPSKRVRLAYSTPSAHAVVAARSISAVLGLPLVASLLPDNEPLTDEMVRAARAREVLERHDTQPDAIEVIAGKTMPEALRACVQADDLVVISSEDFHALDNLIARLDVPVLVAPR